MNLVIKEKKEEPLLSRMEIVAESTFDNATPSENEIKGQIASSLKVNEDVIVIKKISGGFGVKKASILAYKYSDEKARDKIEPKKKEKKKEVQQGGEAPKEAPKGEKKAEEKPKEETKK